MVERRPYYDAEGFVYGYPSELGVVVKDGSVMAVEITSSLRRGDLIAVERNAELRGSLASSWAPLWS